MSQPSTPDQMPDLSAAPDQRTELFAAWDWVADLVEQVRDDQLHEATPCTEYDVRDLITHVASVLQKTTALATTHRDPFVHLLDDPAGLERFMSQLAEEVVDSRTPTQRAAAFRDEIRKARAAWTEDVLDTPIALGWGPILPGRVVSGIYLMEVLAHGWDLATAAGLDPEAPADVAEAGLASAKMALPLDREGWPFGEVQPPPPGAGPTTQLAAWTGRGQG